MLIHLILKKDPETRTTSKGESGDGSVGLTFVMNNYGASRFDTNETLKTKLVHLTVEPVTDNTRLLSIYNY